MQVIDDLFLPDKPLFMFKRPGNLHDFKKKVVAGMKARLLGEEPMLPRPIRMILRMSLQLIA